MTMSKTFYQTSMMSALLAGLYQGDYSVGDLLQHGNFGIGTFNDLDGEMIILGDQVFQLTSTGHVYLVDNNITTPFAAIVDFQPREKTELHRLTRGEFESLLDRQYMEQNSINAIRLTGQFAYMKTRAVPAQKRPYPPMIEVVKHQPITERTHVKGTLLGFKIPDYMTGINVPGYHVHFISDDRSYGGHVSDFILTQGQLETEVFKDFHLRMPAHDEFNQADLHPEDLKAAIHITES